MLQVNDLSFRRLKHGAVRVIYRDPKNPTNPLEIDLTAREWCAIVASVSRVGETFDSFTDAKFVHMGSLPFGPFSTELPASQSKVDATIIPPERSSLR